MTSILTIVLGAIIIITSIIAYKNQGQIRNTYISKAYEPYVEDITPEKVEQNKETPTSYDFTAIKNMSTGDIIQSVEAAKKNQTHLSKLTLGVLHVDVFNIHLPIFKGITNHILAVGVGTMKPEQEMGEGNYALAGHNMLDGMTLLSPIANVVDRSGVTESRNHTNLLNGNKIRITDMTHSYNYIVKESKIVRPKEGNVIDDVEDKKLLTLVTCYQRGYYRTIITAELESITKL